MDTIKLPIARREPAGWKPNIITAPELVQKEFKPIQWAVDGILPEGVTLLVGAPKLGKSWLCLNLAVSVALGGKAFGKVDCQPGNVLYLALEDNQRRMKRRLLAMDFDDPPANLEFSFDWFRLGDEHGDAYIAKWLNQHSDARLIIVDTLKKIRKRVNGSSNLYDSDYEALEPLLTVTTCIHNPLCSQSSAF